MAYFKRSKSQEGSTGLTDKLDRENTAAIADSDHVDTNGDIAASESSTSKVDICSCDSVVFEECNGVPGVSYEVDGKAG